MNSNLHPWQAADWVIHTRTILDSYERLIGKELIPREGIAEDARTLFHAPFVVVAHGTEDDPLLNYGNETALNLWQLPLEDLIGMPSRKTAEPMHRDERAELLRRTQRDGFIDDYSGIRIASTGRRFRIHQATVWNLTDDGVHVGQAAAFSHWTFLDNEKAAE